MLEGGAAGLPGLSALWLVEITASPAPGHAPSPIKGQTAREKAAKLIIAIIPVQGNSCIDIKNLITF